MTCGKAQEFLAQADTVVKVQADAKKVRFDRDAALRLVREATEIWVAKGKRVVHVDLREALPSDDELAALVLGPSGNLRAPVVRHGSKMLVGFDPEACAEVLKA